MNKQTVFRSGNMTPATTGCHLEFTTHADLSRPHRVGRAGALFAAPTLAGSLRWISGNDMCRNETRLREITVDADTTYVYSVDAWEAASWTSSPSQDKIDAFWATGMTLTEWLATPDLDPSNWEVLIDPADVLAVRNVSAKRTLAAADFKYESDEILLKRIVSQWKYAA